MEQIFENYCKTLETESALREEIKVIVKEIDRLQRAIQANLQLVHGQYPKSKELAAKAKEYFPQVAQKFVDLQKLLKTKEQTLKYHDHWKFIVSDLVFVASFMHWLETRKMLNLEEFEALIGRTFILTKAHVLVGKNSVIEGFSVHLEDFLIGLVGLPNELSRLCINVVTGGHYADALEISKFVNEIYAGFRMLNLKNDALRKRFDTIKYDVKKIEEIVYDLSIRKLLPTTTNA